MDTAIALLAAMLNAGTPLLLAAIGVLVCERSGVVNLGVEGMMLVAAVAGFAAVAASGSYTLGFLAGAGAGTTLAALFAIFAIGLGANQYASGLALALFGAGVSAFVGLPYAGVNLPARSGDAWSWLTGIPLLGPVLFTQHPLVHVALLLVAAVYWLLFGTRAGLVLRAVGEAPEAAFALGYRVRTIRTAAVLFGGATAGLAGAYLATVYTPLWSEGMVAGRGWIALALVVFGTWHPLRVAVGAYLFGGVTMLQLHLQAEGVAFVPEWLSMLPYLATIAVLALLSRNARWIRVHMPASLGKSFDPAE
jgi:simple sugar transport system permease protein